MKYSTPLSKKRTVLFLLKNKNGEQKGDEWGSVWVLGSRVDEAGSSEEGR